MMSPELLHYFAAGTSIFLGAIGAGIGLGIAGSGVQNSMTRQPAGNLAHFRATVIGLSLIESGAIIALVTALLILIGRHDIISYELAIAELSMGIAVGVAAISISFASSFIVVAASQAIARQPLFASKILTFMLISQSIIEAPVIFTFLISLLIKTNLALALTMPQSIKLAVAGLIMAIGCIGPSIGQGLFAYAACTAIGTNKDMYQKLFTFSLLNEAIIETPMIFCVLFAILIIYAPLAPTADITSVVKYMVAAFTISIAAMASATGMGYVGSKSCNQIALDPSIYPAMLRSTLLTIALIESSMIYALIVGLFLFLKT